MTGREKNDDKGKCMNFGDEVMFTTLYTYVKAYQIVPFKYVQLVVRQLYMNTAAVLKNGYILNS